MKKSQLIKKNKFQLPALTVDSNTVTLEFKKFELCITKQKISFVTSRRTSRSNEGGSPLCLNIGYTKLTQVKTENGPPS